MIASPPGDPGKSEPERDVFRPIAELGHVEHEIVHRPVPMLGQKITHRGIEVKRGPDGDRGNHDAQKPIKNRAALHK